MNLIIPILLLLMFVLFIIKKPKTCNRDIKNKFFQNNKVQITRSSYFYVYNYKKQLLGNITKLLNDLDIRFVISHGNLIEYERNKKIYHDDDLDIRFDGRDLLKWENFCSSKHDLNKYNLDFDKRIDNINRQKQNGIQARLIKFKNDFDYQEYPEMDIHLYLVLNKVTSNVWIDYNINFDNLRKIKLMGVETYAPSVDDTKKILTKEYGKNYLIPDKIYDPFIKENNLKHIITFGTYDLFHEGHLNILDRSKKYHSNSKLFVGISTDNLNMKKKNNYPIINEKNRLKLIKNILFVDHVFYENSLEEKLKYCIENDIDILVMGNDHVGKFDFLREYDISVVYLPRTNNISTTDIINNICKKKCNN